MNRILVTAAIYATALFQITMAQVPGEICNWDGDKKAAIVLTFDDWSPGQYPIATPELQSRNITATFFIVVRNVSNWKNVQTVVSNGNEVGNHTYSHPYLNRLNKWVGTPPIPPYKDFTAEWKAEIPEAKNLFEQNLPATSIISFAYPMGAAAIINNETDQQIQDAVVYSGHICARGVTAPIDFSYQFARKQQDYYNLTTYSMSSSVNLNEFANQIQQTIKGGGLLTFLYHSLDNGSYYNDSWYNQVQQSEFNKQLDTLVSFRDKVWITTLGQAIKYHKEKNCASLTELQAFNGKKWILSLTDTLAEDSIYNQPLTLKINTKGIKYKKIFQNGTELPIDAIVNDSILFRAIPDRGKIILIAGDSK